MSVADHGGSGGGGGEAGGSPLEEAIRSSGLIAASSSGVVMLSGGADSCALTHALSRSVEPQELVALHFNYGLRPDSGRDEAACDELCRRLGVELVVRRPAGSGGPPTGNLHAWARERRYDAAEALRIERGMDWIAVAHTLSDLVETVIYRLAVSPGTRPLAAMPARRGAIVRPLLSLSRRQVRNAAAAAGLPFVDDASNEDPAFARARIRNEVLPVLGDLNPGFLGNVARTREELEEELDFLADAASDLIETDARGRSLLSGPRLADAHPAIRRLALRGLAERVLGRTVPVSRAQASEICRLAGESEGGRVDLGGGASLVAEAGLLVVDTQSGGADADAQDAILGVPGKVGWNGWTISSEEMRPPFEVEGPDVATLDAGLIGDRVEIRAWREGDRVRPLGMAGSKSLQDLFTDARLRRSDRRRLPLVLARGEIAWVPGITVSRKFRISEATVMAIRLTAEPPPA